VGERRRNHLGHDGLSWMGTRARSGHRGLGWFEFAASKELIQGGARSFRNVPIERIAQYQLDGRLVTREAELFSLFRGDKQIDHLHGGDRLSFSVLLEVLAGGKYLDILEQGLGQGSKTARPAGRSA
jgi:hypothetical protein